MLESRKWIILLIFTLTGLSFLVRLFFIQVIDKNYKIAADDISVKKIIQHPHRGIIYDRNGKLLVTNVPVYDLMVIYEEVKVKDTLVFCKILSISPIDFKKNLAKAKAQSPRQPYPFIKQLSKESFAQIQDQLAEYKGFYVTSRTVRTYPHQSLAHALGYIREISEKALANDKTHYYRPGDFIGINGIEGAYEKDLRGIRGIKHIWVDAKGREKGAFKDGKLDTLSRAGEDLFSTIDLDLQQYAEYLMQNKAGAIAAIEPATGEVLTMVSAPYYDPNLLTGPEFTRNYNLLLKDGNNPLFNRTIQALYPPGSTFKTVQALMGLQERFLDANTVFPCNQMLVKCHGHPIGGLQNSIQYSCNPYYVNVYRRIIYQNRIIQRDTIFSLASDGDGRIGYGTWKNYMDQFNLGRKTGVDLTHELSGNIPKLELYDRRYGEGKWKFSNLYSLGIGQGEIGVLPLQLANVCATIANRGFYYTPHLVKGVGKNKKIREQFSQKHTIKVDKAHFELLIGGMRNAYRSGTVNPIAIIPDLEICGKTGTAQNPHGEDHSVFIAFAPKDNPKIAIAVYVENAGFGGNMAAPVAALLIEKYLKGKISRPYLEKTVLDAKLLVPKTTEPLNKTPEKPKENPPKPAVVQTENRKNYNLSEKSRS
jgi:penicillin-binding protein 2